MRKFEEGKYQRDAGKIKDLRVAFVVDECHRAVTPQTQKDIKAYFQELPLVWLYRNSRSLRKINAKQVGDLAQTTHQQYGERLHEYTVKEAIHDGAVLGFKVDYRNTIISDLLEEEIPDQAYEDKEHMLEVLDAILNKSQQQLSIPKGLERAMKLSWQSSPSHKLRLITICSRAFKAGKERVKVSRAGQTVLPDFPKFTITYSVSENEEESIGYQDHMKQVMEDYNQEFGTHFTIADLRGFNTDVNNRLARKQDKYLYRNEQLDLVIVVNRLWRFWCPLSIDLFIDRKPMRPQDLIQAFSRTNRIFDDKKHFGHIITFQRPQAFKEAVDNALKLYSNGGENEVLAPSWEEEKRNFKSLGRVQKAKSQIRRRRSRPRAVSNSSGKVAKAYQVFDKYLASIRVYSEYEKEEIYRETGLSDSQLEAYLGLYQNILAEIKSRDPERWKPKMSLTSTMNWSLSKSMRSTMPISWCWSKAWSSRRKWRARPSVTRISQLWIAISRAWNDQSKPSGDHPNLWTQVQEEPERYRGQSITGVLDQMIESIIDSHIVSFAKKLVYRSRRTALLYPTLS